METTETQEPKFTGETKTQMLPAKIAANEVLNVMQNKKKWMAIGIGGFFIVILCTVFNKSVGSTCAAAFTVAYAWRMFQDNKRIAYLKEKYHI